MAAIVEVFFRGFYGAVIELYRPFNVSVSSCLPRAFQLFAESMGVSKGELSKLLETGKVGTERLAQFAATLKGALAAE
ncbi:MAG TPA: tape measure protein, partial [Candidatus Obscuribacter sp.]|nr:tape measure protein [Candidatus Obscuribacter sp.]